MIRQKKYFKVLLLCIGLIISSNMLKAQKLPNLPVKILSAADTVKKDSVKKEKPKPKPKIKPYEEVINKTFISQKGLFTVHKNKGSDNDTLYFEIPDTLFNRDIMVIQRLIKTSYAVGMNPGEELSDKNIRFETGPDSTINMVYNLMYSEADSTNNIFKAVRKTDANPVVVTFPIISYNKASKSYVIDVTKIFKDKGFINDLSPLNKGGIFTSSNVNGDAKNYQLNYVHTYPINVEIGSSADVVLKMPVDMPGNIQINTSFIILPKTPMQRRFADRRVGYFKNYFYKFADDDQKIDQKEFILRWRMEPKKADIEKYKRGELVEPKKQIVIYIDPATPKQWQTYLIQGINDWQKAFEQAGFKNAIVGKAWPVNDTTMHMDDARYSFINYFPDTRANAYGPNIHDARSGEIIQTHIGWYANVMSLLHNWYMVQAGATDPKARKAKFDEELMGQLIRFVSSHEVGHTLGLTHNFGSSSQTPVDSLRSKSYLEKHGHTASIMDYARFNYVAQPEDNIPENDLFPHIGEYDRWAIEWGYKFRTGLTEEKDQLIGKNLIVERVSKNHRLWYGDGENQKFDPRDQTEDLGDDAAKAGTYGIKNLRRILPNLAQWTHRDGGTNEGELDMAREVAAQWQRYIMHAMRYMGAICQDIKADDEQGPVFTPVSKAKQAEVLAFFNDEVFTTPTWLMDKPVLDRVSGFGMPDFVSDYQARVLNTLLDVKMFNKLSVLEMQYGDKVYSLDEYLNTLHTDVWKDLNGSGTIKMDGYRRNLQKTYFGALSLIVTSSDPSMSESDISSLLKADLIRLLNEVDLAIPRAKDNMTLYHLKDLQIRIKNALTPKAS